MKYVVVLGDNQTERLADLCWICKKEGNTHYWSYTDTMLCAPCKASLIEQWNREDAVQGLLELADEASTMVCTAANNSSVNAAQALASWTTHPAHAIFVSRDGGYVVCPQAEMWKYRAPAWELTSPETIEQLLAAE